jgi:hypothetical protein
MEILTEGQKAVIRPIARSLLRQEFFLTGGTALSAFYLQHRYSDDLDFFTCAGTHEASSASLPNRCGPPAPTSLPPPSPAAISTKHRRDPQKS